MPTINYCKFKEVISDNVDVFSLIKLYEKIISKPHKLDEEELWLKDIIEQLETDIPCPRCHNNLYLSDLSDYDYFCPECVENFYECEIRR